MLVALAAVNAIFITWAMVLDARHSSALARAFGATPQEVAAGLSATQVLPALVGAVLGILGGIALFEAVTPSTRTIASLWWLIAVVLGTVVVVAGPTTIPARFGARRPVAEILRSELACDLKRTGSRRSMRVTKDVKGDSAVAGPTPVAPGGSRTRPPTPRAACSTAAAASEAPSNPHRGDARNQRIRHRRSVE
jgi:hypothetical protein